MMPFELVDISAADDGQDFELVCAHSLKRLIEPLVQVNVRKGPGGPLSG